MLGAAPLGQFRAILATCVGLTLLAPGLPLVRGNYFRRGFMEFAAIPFPGAPALRIDPYVHKPARYSPYDPQSPWVAAWVMDAILRRVPDLFADHVGSTAIAGCGGKGIIDLLLSYPNGDLEHARGALDRLGFQRQGGPAPFPESRPMRVGTVAYRGRPHQVHAHLIEHGHPQGLDLIRFRDRLRADGALVGAYQLEKLSILSRGITVSTEYSKAKGDFIRRVLELDETPVRPRC